MSGLDQLQYLSWLLFVLIFLAVLRRTIDLPTPAHIDMTLFFGAVAAIIVLSTLTTRLRVTQLSALADVSVVLAISLGYLLLRLVRDFSHVPRLIMRIVVLGIGAAVVSVAVAGNPLPPAFALALVIYLVAVIGYSTWAFARHSARTRGVTRR